MAFTGTATIKQVAQDIVRITGLSLGAGANGTIGLFNATGSAPGVRLPEAFKPDHYTFGGDVVALSDSIMVVVNLSTTPPSESTLFAIEKSGTTEEDWRATITNTFGSASGGIEIYVTIHK